MKNSLIYSGAGLILAGFTIANPADPFWAALYSKSSIPFAALNREM